eukprot:769141-Rhodomonas_salina.2
MEEQGQNARERTRRTAGLRRHCTKPSITIWNAHRCVRTSVLFSACNCATLTAGFRARHSGSEA